MRKLPSEPYPRGWYVVAQSDELPDERPVELRYFGRELVAFRSAGRPAVLDAYCPHLGAHLADGRVCEGTLQCPFHGWRFDGGGRCVEVPRAKKIPPQAATRAWPVHETSGLVMVWHDPAGNPPAWDPPELPELVSPEWLPVERQRWTVKTHVLDTNENNCDAAHLTFLHDLLEVQSSAETDGPVLSVRHAFKADLSRLGMPGAVFEGVVEGTHRGLGVLEQRLRVMVEGLLVSMQTPIDGEHVDLRFAFTVRRGGDETLARTVGAAMWADILRDVADDIRIWERKTYVTRPILSEADGPIGTYRRWVRQFLPAGGDGAASS